MSGWYAGRPPDRPAKAMIAVTLLALLLVAAVPVALLAAVVMMMLAFDGLLADRGPHLPSAGRRSQREGDVRRLGLPDRCSS
jgi:hypothetical protein